MHDESRLFIPLPEADCFRLLGSVRLGRVVYTHDALPAITPVNFALDGHAVIFRTAAGSALARKTDGAVVAFEVDDIDARAHTGWSVVITGLATAVEDGGELIRAAQLHLNPWVPGTHDHYVRVTPAAIAGRRLLKTGLVEGSVGTFGPASGVV